MMVLRVSYVEFRLLLYKRIRIARSQPFFLALLLVQWHTGGIIRKETAELVTNLP